MLRRVQVYTLYGPSGTGKSFRAKLVAQKYKVDLIVDDGLLIHENQILAGKSAKKEKIPFTAIRTALFDERKHLEEVRNRLDKEQFSRILIIGTSKRMVEKIAHRLNLPPITKYISIEDIASKEEIELARHSRTKEGKHIIPVPGIEVQRKYSHIFLDSIKVFFRKSFPFGKKKEVFEKSIVTPEFSKKGKLTISESAMVQMIMHCVSDYNELITVGRIHLKNHSKGFIVHADISVPFGTHLPGMIHELQEHIITNIEEFTGITLSEVSITIGTIS